MPMQPMRKLLLLLVALLIGGGTIVLSRGMMTQPGAPAPAEVVAPTTQEVLVAAKSLPAGTMLQESDLKWQVWPKEEKESGFAIKGKADIKNYVGTVVRYGMQAGEPIMEGRTVKPGEQGFMAAALSPGMRAVSLAITPIAGVAGFVFPGDRVDVIVTHQIGRKTDFEPTGRRVSETMLQDVRVLALDQKMNDLAPEPKVAQIATLEVSPKQAETLALISEMGTISLALRSIANDPSGKASLDIGAEINNAELGKDIVAERRPAVGARETRTLEAITWDSDVSQVLPRPANRTGAFQKILIIRGKEATEAVFDLQQQ